MSHRESDSRRAPADAEAGRDIPRGTDEHADQSETTPKRGDAARQDAPKRNDEVIDADRET